MAVVTEGEESDPRNGQDRETTAALLSSVRRLVDDVLIPAEAVSDCEEFVPEDVIQSMRELGMFGLSVPGAYGGLGLAMVDEVGVLFELCRASPSFRSLLGRTVGVGGKSIVSFCLTELQSGSDAAALQTRAVRDGNDYRLTGAKRFISNAPIAGLFLVLARTKGSDHGSSGISAFLVEAGTPGLSVGPSLKKMGHRGAPVADVFFQDCRVLREALLGMRQGQGFRTAMKVLDQGRIHVAAVAGGLAAPYVEEALDFTKTGSNLANRSASFS